MSNTGSISVVYSDANVADLIVGSAVIKIGKVKGRLKVISKYPSECRVPKKLMHAAYVAAAEAMKLAQQ